MPGSAFRRGMQPPTRHTCAVQRRHIQPGLAKVETGVEQSVKAPLLDGRQRIRGQVGQRLLAKLAELVVLHIHADRQLEGFPGQRSLEQIQLCVGTGMRDGVGVVVHAHRQADTLAFDIVALKGRVDV